MVTKGAAKRQVLGAARLVNTQYGCGSVQFAGTSEALYERHLLFNSGVDLAPDYFNFEELLHGDFVEAFTQTRVAETLTGVLYPDHSRFMGQGLRLMQEYSLVACSLASAMMSRVNASSSVRYIC